MAEKEMDSKGPQVACLGNFNLSPTKPGLGSRQASYSQVTMLTLRRKTWAITNLKAIDTNFTYRDALTLPNILN